ncbi:MAG: alpha/beta hydrolase [Halioglobus sp.]|nr:alpha/beta hydrolase [Halioglobus sp.]
MRNANVPGTFRQSAKGLAHPSGVFVELPGIGSYFYRQHLNPGKPTLLLVHGMVVSSGLNWFRLFPALSRHFNIIAPDVRGHGRSSRGDGRFTFEMAADDLAALIEEVECGPVIAVGYSMGGAIIQHLWHQHPQHVAGLVLAATNYKARVARHEELVVLPFFAAMVGLGNAVELFGHLPKGLIKRFLPRLADQLHEDDTRWALDELRRASLRMVFESGREMATHDASEWLHEIDVPTAVVCTRNDRAIPQEHQREMAELIDGCQLFEHDDGHLACIDPEFGEVLAKVCLSVARRVNERGRKRA